MDNPCANKRILIGITGGIAAYKALDLISMLKKDNASVKVIMTANAAEFVNPLSFEAISGNPVYTQMFSKTGQWEIDHISLAKWAELIAVVPATANILGKINHGIADDLLSTTIMATKAGVIFAPAMNTQMYQNPIVIENIYSLTKKGYNFIPPAQGRLACGDWGEGKLADIQDIYTQIKRSLSVKADLSGLKVLVTAGPTREYIDPARFISNPSTGKMGYAIAKAAIDRGAQVFLVSGPTHLVPPEKANFYPVETAEQMYRMVLKLFSQCDLLFKAAAVSDYRPAEQSKEKMKKDYKDAALKLVINPDILKEAGKIKTNQVVVGFAAETENVEQYAKEKMKNKNLDFILANDISLPDTGFGTDTNQGVLFTRKGEVINIPMLSKNEFAHRLLDEVMKRYTEYGGKRVESDKR
jgi:phosphopantothenoylcysteine decarboxylase/phosphopantothenate--cysteine ligase